MSKISYLVGSTLRYFSSKGCPSCGGNDVAIIDTKYIVTRLFKCKKCLLLFRHPKDSSEFNFKFYQKKYSQKGLTTDLPSAEELESLKANNFKGKTAALYTKIFLELFKDVEPQKIKLVDYGCSWGYQSYQFLKSGFDCNSFEISRPRAEFGNTHLGLAIKTEESELPSANDIFFSCHVIEHVPSPGKMIEFGLDHLQRGGYFVAECPNGSDVFRKNKPDLFHVLWGMVHPNMLTAEYYSKVFEKLPHFITTSPFDNIIDELRGWDGKSGQILDLTGSELLVVAKKV
jgi:hypothetical protein